jgi:archaellum component FlaC
MDIINTFEVSIYGNLVPFEKNPLLSLARVRIFYKGLNRNRTFITDEFAEKLISSLPYTPVSGIWDEDDFSDHGNSREEGRIYGLVPENPNGAWEKHLDKDGIERTYYCCDVVLFTTRYTHAAQILEKPQSMELYKKSIKGNWMIKDGIKCYCYTDGCFIGLQVLGDDVEPCFEGAAFYSYANSLKEMIDILKNYSLNGGKEQMELNFKLSDREKRCAIFSLLNPNFNEEGNWEINYEICEIYDEYALVYNGQYFRCYYTKDDEQNSITLGDIQQTYVMDISEAEVNALNAVRAANGGVFTEIDTKYQSAIDENATLKGEKENCEATIATLTETNNNLQETVNTSADTIATLNSKVEELNEEINTQKDSYTTLETEVNSLREFKKEIEKQEKLGEISKYSMLDAEIINKFTAEIENYSLVDLQNALKVEYVNANANTIFANNPNKNNPTDDQLIYNLPNGQELTGAARLINNHKKNGGK